MELLIQFLLRLSFGLTAGMAITSSRKVTSGYFRNHLYVTLGLATLAAMVSFSVAPEVFWYAVGAAVASYVASVCWLYESPVAGKLALLVVLTCSVTGALDFPARASKGEKDLSSMGASQEAAKKNSAQTQLDRSESVSVLLKRIGTCSSGLLLGMTMAAMLLGHWYLNSPTMELAPLRKLILAMAGAVGLQAIVSSLGLWGELTYAPEISTQWILFLLLRWLFGLVGVAILSWMAWQTLKIPNTQSATGILYVAVIGTFVGETMSLLLSSESLFPL